MLRHGIAWALFFWAGLLVGVSFVATPAKFLAPSLPLPIALDVGRATFHVLAFVEWALLAAVALAFVASWTANVGRRGVAVLLLLVAICLAVETFGLRPYLDARVSAIMAGEAVAPNHAHTAYVVLEAAKLAFLVAAGILQGRSARAA